MRTCARLGNVDGLGIFIIVAGERQRSDGFETNGYKSGNWAGIQGSWATETECLNGKHLRKTLWRGDRSADSDSKSPKDILDNQPWRLKWILGGNFKSTIPELRLIDPSWDIEN